MYKPRMTEAIRAATPITIPIIAPVEEFELVVEGGKAIDRDEEVVDRDEK